MNKEFIGVKILLVSLTLILVLTSINITSTNATTTQLVTFKLNSANFQVTSTNGTFNDSFIYSYNVSSVDSFNATLKFEIYRLDEVYLYLFDTLTDVVPLSNNTVVNQIAYNFSLSGSYTIKVYWFAQNNSILEYNLYQAPFITVSSSVQSGNTYTGTYEFSYFYNLVDSSNNIFYRDLSFSIDFYFTAQYNFTLNYGMTLCQVNSNQSNIVMVNDSKNMNGQGNTVQSVKLTIPISSPGSYQVIFSWKDFVINQNVSILRTIGFQFNTNLITNQSTTSFYQYPFNENSNYYHQEIIYSPLPSIISFFFSMGVFFCIVYLVFRKKPGNYTPRYYTPLNNNFHPKQPASIQPKISSYCSNCGSKILSIGSYCPDCGTKLD